MNEEHFYVLTQMEKQNKKNDQRLKLHMTPKIRDQGLTTMYWRNPKSHISVSMFNFEFLEYNKYNYIKTEQVWNKPLLSRKKMAAWLKLAK